jgi:hypothetical protein
MIDWSHCFEPVARQKIFLLLPMLWYRKLLPNQGLRRGGKMSQE